MDDLSSQIAQRRQQLDGAAALQEMLARSKGGKQPEADGKPEPAKEAAPQDDPLAYAKGMAGASENLISGVKNAAKDIGKGVMESPRAVGKGVSDAFASLFRMGDDLSGWLEAKSEGTPFEFMNAGINFDSDGVHLMSPKESKGIVPMNTGNLIPGQSMANPTSVTGGLIKGTAQFLTGFKGAGQLTNMVGLGKAAGAAGYGVAALKGALSSFTAFDPHQQRLSNLVEQFPALQNPITDYLQAKPEDGNAEGRFKNALEGLGMGVITDGLMRGVRYLRSAAHAKMAAQEAIPKLEPEELKSEVESLLNPQPKEGVVVDAPKVVKLNADAAEKLYAAANRTQALAPDDIVSRMAAPLETAESSAAGRDMAPPKTFINFSKIDTGEDVQKAMQSIADAMPVKAATEGKAELIDTVGSGKLFHGSSSRLGELDENFYSTMNIYGQGLYTTDSVATAVGYTKKGAKVAMAKGAHSPTVYETTVRGSPKLFDLEAPVPAAVERMLSGSRQYGTNELASNILAENPQMTLRKLFDEVRAESASEGYTADDVQGFFDSARANLEKEGYRGYTHAGGKLVKGAVNHNVSIFWNPASDIEITPADLSKYTKQVPVAADTAKAGVRTFEAIKLDAAHENAWQALFERRQGQPLADSEMLASRQLWASATDKLAQLAQEAATAPSDANLFAFRKMLATHNVIQNEVLGARAAIARAQASMRIPVGSSAERLKELQFSLEQNGGSEVAKELAGAISGMSKAGMISEMATAAEKGAFAKTVDAAKEAWTLGLLTSPKTHLRNILSNTLFVPQQMLERAAAAHISDFIGDPNGVQVGEAAAQYAGMKSGVADMFRYYSKQLKARIGATDESLDDVLAQNPVNETGLAGASKMDLPPAISSQSFNVPEDSWLGRAANTIGSAYGITTNALQAEDNFFKVLGYRMETHAQAFRQANQEAMSGAIEKTALADRMAELISSPPENIRMASTDQALYQTFNQAPGWFGESLLKLKRQSLVAHILIPFARTTTNLMHASFERTPMAPLVGQWRADLAAGGARRDIAIARWTIGSAATFALIDATMSGKVSGRGPVDAGARQALQREGWKPYSINIGDRWYTYNGISPIGDQIGMAADLAEMAMHGNEQLVEGKDMEKVTTATVAAIAGNIMNKSYLSGLADAINAVSDPTANAASWARSLAGSLVPSIVNATRQAADPNVRAVNSMMDAIKAKIPGLSKDLPARHDLWGREMKTESGYGKPFDVLSPVFTQKPEIEPIDKELLRLGANIQMPPSRVSFGAQGDASGFEASPGDAGLRGSSIDLKKYPEAYERYVELAGNALKHPAWNLGAKDLLNQIVEGKHALSPVYNMRSDGPDGGKDVFIQGIITQYRALARRKLLDEYPQIKREANARAANVQALKMPVQ